MMCSTVNISRLTYIVFAFGLIEANTNVSYTGSSILITCPLTGDYTLPAWLGPSINDSCTIAYTLEHTKGFNPILGEKANRISYAENQRDILLKNLRWYDSGLYQCSINSGEKTDNYSLEVRVRPAQPEIETNVTVENNSIRATEGRPFRITCTSHGGYPAPTVAWYRGDNAGPPVKMTNMGTRVGDTYNVTLSYTFTPTRQDDRQQLVCRSYWPTPANAQGLLQESVSMYLNLKPVQQSVTQTSTVVAGDNVTFKCRTTGSRPEANISWTYQDQTYRPTATVTNDTATQTFNTVSVLQRPVTATDNGQTVECRASHIALDNDLISLASLNVQFPVGRSTTNITGNRVQVADGKNQLFLICITGSSNPPAVITWKNGTSVILVNNGYTNSTGANNGVIRSQTLQIIPTRYDHGDNISCSATNGVKMFTDTKVVTLNIYFTPVVTISSTSSITLTEQPSSPPTELTCRVESNPPATITWYHNGQFLLSRSTDSSVPYIIREANRSSYGNYTCTADNTVTPSDSKTYTVEVLFRPLEVSIRKAAGNVTANGQNPMSITCTSGTSNPVFLITWDTGTIQTNMPSYNDSSGKYGGTVRTSMISFNPIRVHDGATVSCKARNSVTGQEVASDSTVIDNIIYSPLIIDIPDRDVIEGDNVTLSCHASSKPAASFTWKRGSVVAINDSVTTFYNGLNYTFNNISREQDGIYTCTADNQVQPSDSKQTLLRVLYPPSIKVYAINTTINSSGTNVTCEASGVPDQYTYKSWVHTWNGHVVNHSGHLAATRVLKLTHLSYAHSGVYMCGASNGVKGVSFGEGTLLVKSPPVLVGDVAKTFKIKASGQLTKTTTVTFQYYSNTGRGNVTVQKSNGTGENVGDVQLRDVNIRLPVFLSDIDTTGTEVTVNITVNDMSQFGDYDVFVTNGIMDSVRLNVIVQPLGPPEPPMLVNSTVVDQQSVIILWISGFPNGRNQTFVIQLSTDNITWQNITINGGMAYQETHSKIIDNLASNQTYYLRMLAFNANGESELTRTYSFRTAASHGPPKSHSIGMIAGGAAGGGLAAAVVIVIIVIVWRRKAGRIQGSAKDKGAIDISSNHNEGYDNGDEEVINRLYESAGVTETAVGASTNKQVPPADVEIYAKVNKKPEVVYAVPDKQKGKKLERQPIQKAFKSQKDRKKVNEKHDKKKPKTGDVYENAPIIMSGNTSAPQCGESVYEETSISAPTTPKKPTGTDGLLYAELEFAPKRKGPSKIIGIDDRCEYTTIDLTKKAQPLSDSDDEDKTNT